MAGIYEIEVRPGNTYQDFSPYTETVEALTSYDAVGMVQRRNPGCQVLVTRANSVPRSSNSESSSSLSLGELGDKFIGTVVLGVFTILLCSVGAGSDEKSTPVETPQPAAIERVEYNPQPVKVTPTAPVEVEKPSSSGPCVTENFEPC